MVRRIMKPSAPDEAPAETPPAQPASEFDTLFSDPVDEYAWVGALADRISIDPDDVPTIYAETEKLLTFGDGKLDTAIIMRAADQISVGYRNAHRLLQTATRNRKIWARQNEKTNASLRDRATRTLQAQKASGERAKQITDADVTAEMWAAFPDEMQAQHDRGLEFESVEKSLQNLVDVIADRSRILQVMISKTRA